MMEFNGHKVWKLQVLWGKQHGVIFLPSSQKLFVERDEIIILSMPENSTEKQKNDFLKNSMKKLLQDEIEKLMPKWESITGLKSSSWFIDKSKTSWGWCETSSGKIMLNENLIYKPKECLEYVLLHWRIQRLCHARRSKVGA